MRVLILTAALLCFSTAALAGSYKAVEKWRPEVEAASKIVSSMLHVKIDPSLMLSMMHQESKGQSHARSSKGAYGLMQLTEQTARHLEALTGCPALAFLKDPSMNIFGGVLYFGLMKKKYGSDKIALIVYNAGEGNYRSGRFRQFRETMHYFKVILAKRNKFKDS